MEASDVIASLNHHRGEDTKSGAKGIVSPVKEMKADGKHVGVISLEGGNADFPFVLNDYHLAIAPGNASGKIDAKSGIGAGAYKVDSYEPGVGAKLSRNKDYWRTDYGHFDNVEVLTIADVAARTNALTTGEVDAIDRLDIKTLHLLKRNKKISIKETSGTAHYSAPMRADRGASRPPRAARSSSTRSGTCRSRCKSSCFAYCRRRRSDRSAMRSHSASTLE